MLLILQHLREQLLVGDACEDCVCAETCCCLVLLLGIEHLSVVCQVSQLTRNFYRVLKSPKLPVQQFFFIFFTHSQWGFN